MVWTGAHHGGEGTDDGDFQGRLARAFPPAWQSKDLELEMN